MRDYLEVFAVDREEFKKLEKACDYLNELANDTQYHFEINRVLFDASQGWWYTGIMCYDDKEPKDSVLHRWHFFCPRDHERLFTDTWENIESMLEDKVDKLILENMK